MGEPIDWGKWLAPAIGGGAIVVAIYAATQVDPRVGTTDACETRIEWLNLRIAALQEQLDAADEPAP